jgi:hypothetical protein
MIAKTWLKNKSLARFAQLHRPMSLASFSEFVDMAAECLALLSDFTEGMHNPLAELTKVFVESKGGSDAESLHDCEAGAIRKTESLIRILAEDGPGPFFIGWGNPNDRSRGLAQQTKSKLQGLLVPESHSKKGDCFVNDQIAGDEKPIRRLHVL